MAGVVLLFYGLFGRAFVFGPFFVLGVVVAAYGLVGVVLGYIGFESCGVGLPGTLSSCMAYHPELFEPFILLGGSLISVNAYSWYSGLSETHRMSRRALARFLGVVSVFVGTVLFLSGWAVVATFVGNYVEIYWEFWLQVVAGLALMPAGMLLIGLSSEVGRNRNRL